jgi:serine protease inhibitor
MVDANRLFNADIFTTGFPEARIADWVARHTNGRMERYHVPNGTEFLAINAAAIKSRWEISFDPTLSKIRRFVGSSTTSRVRFMQRDGYFELLENASFKILRLRLQNRFSIYFGLRSPGANGKVDEFLGYALKSGSFDHRRARVLIPQFSLNKHTNLKSSLITEGLIAAFSPAAQFDQIGNVRITNAFQDIAFAIDEVGAEVESATTFVQQQGMTLEPTIFNANRPFYYSLIEDQTNHVFLIGSMENM